MTPSKAVTSTFSALLSCATALAAPGDLDPTFGSGGLATASFGDATYSHALVHQPDGKLVQAGYAYTGPSGPEIALARYGADGTLDSTFGVGGLVTTGMPGYDGVFGYALVLQPDGKLVVAGCAFGESGEDIALVRYAADGSLDGTFGAGGRVIAPIGSGDDCAFALALQSGMILAAGCASNGTNDEFAVARFDDDGSLDATFGSGGVATTPIGSGDACAGALALQSDGKLVAAGGTSVTAPDWPPRIALTRYDANGGLDATFGSGGIVTTIFVNHIQRAHALAIQSDGKLVIAGEAYVSPYYQFLVARYDGNGSLDGTFGSGGGVLTSIGSNNDHAYALQIQPDGKVVAAGTARDSALGPYTFALVRYEANGALDGSFGSGGKVRTANTTTARGLVRQPDAKLVAAGHGFVIARYLGDDSPVPTTSTTSSSTSSTSTSSTSTSSSSTTTTSTLPPLPLNVTFVRLRRDSSSTSDNGRVMLRGDFLTNPPADVFDADSGIGLRVQDGLALDRTISWTGGDCRRSNNGAVKCRNVDGTTQGKFIPLRATPALFRFRVTLRRLDIAAPFQAPVGVTLSHGAGVVRTGAIASCASSNAGLKCPL